VILVVFGALVGFEAPNVGGNLPTMWIGVWERIGMAGFVLWGRGVGLRSFTRVEDRQGTPVSVF
jgi:hypothetical protein